MTVVHEIIVARVTDRAARAGWRTPCKRIAAMAMKRIPEIPTKGADGNPRLFYIAMADDDQRAPEPIILPIEKAVRRWRAT